MSQPPPLSTLFPYTTLFRSPRQQEPYDQYHENSHAKHWDYHKTPLIGMLCVTDRKSGSAGMPRPISYAVFCLKKKTFNESRVFGHRLGQWRDFNRMRANERG